MRDAETAYAKINLALHVRERMADGYHRIETLFAFAEDGDELAVEPAADLGLLIDGPFAAGLSNGPDNLVLRAAAALREAFGIEAGARLSLTKRLPVASGIGGGSADAAAALRLLTRHWGVDAADPRIGLIAASLGADVPACLTSRTQRGEGRGDRLEPVDGSRLSGLPLLLVNPGVAVETGPVFRAWDGVDRGPLGRGDPLGGRNDLQAPAIELVPRIGALLDRLANQSGVILARMSGSGATCFALFERAADRDQAHEALAGPGVWRFATRLR